MYKNKTAIDGYIDRQLDIGRLFLELRSRTDGAFSQFTHLEIAMNNTSLSR